MLKARKVKEKSLGRKTRIARAAYPKMLTSFRLLLPKRSARHIPQLAASNTRRRTLSGATGAACGGSEDDAGKRIRRHEHARAASPILEDRYGRFHNYLRISLTERCNLRCQYCMPEEGVPLQPDKLLLSTEEIIELASVFVSEGVDKIRLTGGEPLVRRDIVDICQSVGRLDGLRRFGITTNGILLERKLEQFEAAGVNMLNISLDTLVSEKFRFITRRPGFERVKRAIDRALEANFAEIKVNCVVKRGFNEDEVLDFVEWTRHEPIEVRFIEYMPFGGNQWKNKLMISYFEMVDLIRQRYPEFSRQRSIDGRNPTSKTWKVPGFVGSVGFISSMSDNFCGSCNRLRLTADGNLKPCLFGSREVSLRDVLRDKELNQEERLERLHETILSTVLRKDAKLGGHSSPEAIARAESNRPMILIGG